MVIDHYKETREYDTDKITNALGGALSLVMGFSLYSAAELAELVVNLIIDCFQCLRSKPEKKMKRSRKILN